MKMWNVKIFNFFPVSLFAIQRRRSHKSGWLGIQLRGPCASYQGQSSVPPGSLIFISQTSSRLERCRQFSFGSDGTDRYTCIYIIIIRRYTVESELNSNSWRDSFRINKAPLFINSFYVNIISIAKKFILRQNEKDNFALLVLSTFYPKSVIFALLIINMLFT